MIQLKLTNERALINEIENKASGIKELTNPVVLNTLADAIYSITKREFIKDINRVAKSNQKKFHHLYEWDRVGNNSSRLFDIIKVSSNSNKIVVDTVFKKSKTLVPLSQELASPGVTGRLIEKRHIFSNKAEMMEKGQRAGFVAKRNIVFGGSEGLVFRSKGQNIALKMPEATQGQLGNFMKTWYATRLVSVIEKSGVFKKMESTTANALSPTGSGAIQVRESVISMLRRQEVINNV